MEIIKQVLIYLGVPAIILALIWIGSKLQMRAWISAWENHFNNKSINLKNQENDNKEKK